MDTAGQSKLGDYEVLETIGTGCFGTVSKIRRKCDDKILVWKRIKYGLMSDKEKQLLVSEVNIMRKLRHPNVVRYYDHIVDNASADLYVITEFCANGDLGTLIQTYKLDQHLLEEDLIWKLFAQVTLALQECHRGRKGCSIVHRDLKPANIFLDKDNNAKLGDFGLARVLRRDETLGQSKDLARTFCGTPYYMAPEQIAAKAYDEKADIWALGCLLYEMCCLRLPFDATCHNGLAIKIAEGRYTDISSAYSNDLRRLVRSLLQPKPEDRPSIETLLELRPIQERIAHMRLSIKMEALQRRENNVKRRETTLLDRERHLSDAEAAVTARERACDERSQQLAKEKMELRKLEEEIENKIQSMEMLHLELQRYAVNIPNMHETASEIATVVNCHLEANTRANNGTTAPLTFTKPISLMSIDDGISSATIHSNGSSLIEDSAFIDNTIDTDEGTMLSSACTTPLKLDNLDTAVSIASVDRLATLYKHMRMQPQQQQEEQESTLFASPGHVLTRKGTRDSDTTGTTAMPFHSVQDSAAIQRHHSCPTAAPNDYSSPTVDNVRSTTKVSSTIGTRAGPFNSNSDDPDIPVLTEKDINRHTTKPQLSSPVVTDSTTKNSSKYTRLLSYNTDLGSTPPFTTSNGALRSPSLTHNATNTKYIRSSRDQSANKRTATTTPQSNLRRDSPSNPKAITSSVYRSSDKENTTDYTINGYKTSSRSSTPKTVHSTASNSTKEVMEDLTRCVPRRLVFSNKN